MIKLYLFDIEGTTTDINFVHKVLFPYSEKNLEEYVIGHQSNETVSKALKDVKTTVHKEEGKDINTAEALQKLKEWIAQDRKHPALKEIQGLIWDSGYTKNHFKGHVYPDVEPFFQKILSTGKKVGIYSSGSVHAQKLIFGYSELGDLTPFISYYFDTKVGGKRERSSYENIARETGLGPNQIHFFSDVVEEINAAKEAGLAVTHVVRDGGDKECFDCVKDFEFFMNKL